MADQAVWVEFLASSGLAFFGNWNGSPFIWPI
jgi:hypothetical protein